MAWPNMFFKSRPKFTPLDKPKSSGENLPEKPLSTSFSPTEIKPTALPGTGGTVMSVGTRPSSLKIATSAAKGASASVTTDMADADALRAMTRVGGLRVTKRQPEPEVLIKSGPILTPTPGLSAIVHKPEVTSGAVAAPTAVPEGQLLEASKSKEEIIVPFAVSAIPSPKPSRLPMFFRRKAKMTDVAKIVLPPKSEEPAPEPSSVVPPSFAVPAAAGTVLEKSADVAEKSPEKQVAEQIVKPVDAVGQKVSEKDDSTFILHLETKLEENPRAEAKNDNSHESYTFIIPPEAKSDEVKPAGELPREEPLPAGEKAPEGELPAMEPLSEPLSKSEAGPDQAKPTPLAIERAPREFLLANGERVLGAVLSETPEALYVDHKTLGVLTIPRAQIATRPIEIILINGDRIVGDLIAENAECLYVRHASLGMLTVPHTQRSTRVVEAILKDGDRILGEVLAENETSTVIRSSTLGTVTVPHAQVSMLNRKVEQIQLKALPAPSVDDSQKPA